ncbi:MAG: tetratricopeptide repeat protein, partial [Deltaproteobacteria bacterium]|nr:tetratricopeptide repeat protein [Deltaproteobacteria bacterium]
LKRIAYLARVYALGFCFLAFWLVPLLAYSKYTTPYADVWQIRSIDEIAPTILLPVLIAAGIGSAGMLARHLISRKSVSRTPLHLLGFLCFGILVSVMMFVLAPKIGLVDIRYVPFAQLTMCLLGGLVLGWLGSGLHRWGLTWVYLLAVVGATMAWTDSRVKQVPDWAKWDYEGFEAKPSWPLFQEINGALRGTFRDPRVVYEHSSRHNLFGSMRAFESLPLFAGRATLEGLYMQASISSPFVFYIQSEISEQKSTPFHQYSYTDMDFDRARAHLEMFNVGELILRGPEAKAAIRSSSGYHLRETFGDYEIWQLDAQSGRYVVPLKNEPVLYVTRDWKTDSFRWFINPGDRPRVHLVFTQNPTSSEKKHFKTVSTSLKNVPEIPIDTDECRVKETIGNDEILIETNWINKPLLVKMSFHPNWRVDGADGIYLVSPSFMMVFPKEKRVRLYYSKGMPEHAGRVLTGIGLLILMLNLPLPRSGGKTAWSIFWGRFRPAKFPHLRAKWDPSDRLRVILLACGIGIAVFAAGWFSYHSYQDEPSRLFNRAIKLKDARRFHEARRGFRRTLLGVSPLSRLAEDSAYYIAICYYLQKNDPAAIRAFEALVDRYPYGRRVQEAHYHIGLCLFRTGEEQKGIDRMKRLLKRYPGTMWAGFAKDRLREHHAFDGDAITPVGKNVSQRMGLAIRFFNEERLDEAKPLFEAIVKNHPKFKGAPQALACLALIGYKQKDFSNTIRYYQQLIERYPADRLVPEAYYHTGRSFEMLGDRKKAKETYNELKAAFPETSFGKRAGDRLRTISRVKSGHLEQ